MTPSIAEKFAPFNAPEITEEEIFAVGDVLRSGWIGTGKVASQFEEEFAEFYGGGYAVAVSSCTMGLQLCLEVLGGVEEGEEVITTPLTFAATLNSIILSGYTPILVDVDETGCIDLEEVTKHADSFTKAIIPVHYSGTPCKTEKLKTSAPIIEDCAHAFGGHLGTGLFKVFSFYANKNITSGEGGMVLTKDKVLADKIRILSSQGLSLGAWNRFGKGANRRYFVEQVGFKGNMPDVLAAIGLAQLRRWPLTKEKRLKVFTVYEQEFGAMPKGHSTHFYPFRSKNRDKIRSLLYKKGIGTGIHYRSLHLEPAYDFLEYPRGSFPKAEAWGEEELSLPVSPLMTQDDAYRIVEIIKGETND